MNFTNKDILRFLDKIIFLNNHLDCWDWNACKDKNGYGIFSYRGYPIKAHRYSYQLFYKCSILPNYQICHTCDNPSCVNPIHLWIGTNQENVLDRNLKGRSETCGKWGVNNDWLSVSDEQTIQIINDINLSKVKSVEGIINKHNVSETWVRNLLSNNCRKNILKINPITKNIKRKFTEITNELIQLIEDELHLGILNQNKIAIKFNVSRQTISNIKNKKYKKYN